MNLKPMLTNYAKGLAVAGLSALPLMAHAAIDLPIITDLGCDVVNWMKGPLGIIVFMIVAVVTIVIGMFAKMDWTKILTIVILYGILQGLFGIAASTGFVNLPSCFSA